MMLRIKSVFVHSVMVALFAFAISGNAYAGRDTILAANNRFTAESVYTYVNYAETAGGTLLDTEKGSVPGFGLDFSLMRDGLVDDLYFDLRMSFVNGYTNYVGSYIGSGGGYGSAVGTSSATVADYDLRLGKGFWLGYNAMLTPYLELGYHRWDRSYETYRHSYYAVGARLQTSIARHVVFSVNGMVGNTFLASINVNLPPPMGLSAGLGSSTIWRVGGSVDIAVARNLHINFGADYMGFKYGMSTVSPTGYYEPNSSTKYTIFRSGISYAF